MRYAVSVIACLVGVFLVLSIPAGEPPTPPAPEHSQSFAWSQDSYWELLEAKYAEARNSGCAASAEATSRTLSALASDTEALRGLDVDPDAAVLRKIEADFFAVGAYVAACPDFLDAYLEQYARMRKAIKYLSRGWDLQNPKSRNRLYRSLYGGRTAIEEVMLQHPDRMVTVFRGTDEPSAAPSALVRGVEVHSGDMLVSRGGAPTSSLIARGSDYPGNFSHVALVHVDEGSQEVSVIEAHIEVGVTVSPAERYLGDKKLRIMLLRPRNDLPQMVADPLLPHRAASLALARARSGHIAYDFEMDYSDPSRLFCSEVVSSVYAEHDIDLWMGISTISNEGLRRWLASFGVRHFKTQEPSDLEYDPQLVVVAEWRDPASLAQDRIDNAVIDAMLEGAERGDTLHYPWYQLPVARLAKAYSLVLEGFGRAGPVPEGMSAEASLRSLSFSARHHRIAERVGDRAEQLGREKGYPVPYWGLLELAREATQMYP